MPTQKKMPQGKDQFGIIVLREIHKAAKHMATERNTRISDVYARGIEALMDAEHAGRGPDEMRLLKSITRNIKKETWVYFEAVADFFRGDPADDDDKVSMLKLILGKHLPEEVESLPSKRRQARRKALVEALSR